MTITIDPDKSLEDIHDLSFINDYRLIRLATSKETLIGEIDQVVIYEEYVYVADFYKSKAIYIFDTLGNYLHKIDNLGRGSDEYMQLRGIWIDSLDRTFNFISRVDRKHFVYDITGTHLIEIKKLPKTFNEIEWNGRNLVGYSGNYIEDKKYPFNVWILDSNDQIEKGYFEIPLSWESNVLKDGKAFSEFEGNIYYVAPMDFNVCLLTNAGEVRYPYYLDFGKFKWPSSDLSPAKRKEILRNGRNYIDRIYRFQETERFIFSTFILEGRKRCTLYEKVTGEVHVCDFSPSTDKYLIPFGEIVGMTKDRLITTVSASQVKRNCDGDEFNDFEKEYPVQVHRMRTEFPSIDEGDNPFLVVYFLN